MKIDLNKIKLNDFLKLLKKNNSAADEEKILELIDDERLLDDDGCINFYDFAAVLIAGEKNDKN